jgi:hypothetical protein
MEAELLKARTIANGEWEVHMTAVSSDGFSYPCMFQAIREIICRLTNVDIHATSEWGNCVLFSELKGALD